MMSYETILQQMQAYAEPWRGMSSAMLGHWEKITGFQLDMARRYTDVTLAQLREASDIRSPEQLQGYVQRSTEAARETSDSMVRDARTLAEMGQAMTEELQETAREQVSQMAPQAGAAEG